MSEASFSPGPWTARRNNSFWQIDAGDFGQIGDSCSSSCTEEFGGSEELGRANAYLMAAAPDLYAALKVFADLGVGCGPGYETETYRITRDAIRAARAACGQHMGRMGWAHDDDPALQEK